MANNIAVTPGSGALVATDERSILGETVHVHRVTQSGSATIVSGRVSVTTTAAEEMAEEETRTRVILLALPTNTDVVEVGDSGVASGSDFPLYPGASLTLNTTAAIWMDAASGTQSVAYIEELDG